MLGWRSLALWPQIIAEMRPAAVRRRGSLLLAHRSDLASAQRVLARLAQALPGTPRAEPLSAAQLGELEPAVRRGRTRGCCRGRTDRSGRGDARLARRSRQASWNWNGGCSAVEEGALAFDDGTRRALRLFRRARHRRAARAAGARRAWRDLLAACAGAGADAGRCACCIRAIACTWCRARPTSWWWAPARSRARTARRCRCAARWNCWPRRTACARAGRSPHRAHRNQPAAGAARQRAAARERAGPARASTACSATAG